MDEQRQDDQIEHTQQLCADTGCSREDLPEAMDDREMWRERFRDIRTDGATWWKKAKWVECLPMVRSRFNPRSRHTKDFKMVLDTSLLNTQQYKVRIKGKVEQSSERSSALPYTLV